MGSEKRLYRHRGTVAGEGPLCVAAGSGHGSIVEMLIERGADVNTQGGTPLSSAVKSWGKSSKEREAVVKALLQAGANPNSVDSRGCTPLCHARNGGMVRLLIEAGANPNLGRDNGETPLMLAVKRGDAAAVKLLLDKGADTEIKNKEGLAPLLVAAQRGDLDTIKLLVEKHANLETEDPKGRTPLSWAGWNRRDAAMKYLMESGAAREMFVGQIPQADEEEEWYGS